MKAHTRRVQHRGKARMPQGSIQVLGGRKADRRKQKGEVKVQFLNELILRVINAITPTEEEGQTLVEYALIIALVSVTAIVALQAISGGVNGVFSSIASTLSGAV
jgi:pilus assembly protein Flp/PilA